MPIKNYAQILIFLSWNTNLLMFYLMMRLIHETSVVNPELCKEYEKLTRGQSASKDWKRLRKFRLTSSKNFKPVASSKRDFERLAQSILNEKFIQTAAMKYGLEHDNEAAHTYVDVTGNNFCLCGIVIIPSAPYLACSPDRRVFHNSENGPEQFGLLEIKYPQATTMIEMPYLVDQDNKFHLKPVHTYFFTKFKDKGIVLEQSRVTSWYIVTMTTILSVFILTTFLIT